MPKVPLGGPTGGALRQARLYAILAVLEVNNTLISGHVIEGLGRRLTKEKREKTGGKRCTVVQEYAD